MGISQKIRTLHRVIISQGVSGVISVGLRKLIPPGNFILNWDRRVFMVCDSAPGRLPPSAEQRACGLDNPSAYLCGVNGQTELSIGAARARGERAWAVLDNQRVNAYVWISSPRTRNFSDTGAEIGKAGCWWRDAYIEPHYRGRGLLANLLLAWRSEHPAEALVTEVHPDNVASLKAHAKLGFVELARLSMVCLLGMRVYRVQQQGKTQWRFRFAPRNLYRSSAV